MTPVVNFRCDVDGVREGGTNSLIMFDSIVGPRDLEHKTWHLNKARLRAWDYYTSMVRTEEKE